MPVVPFLGRSLRTPRRMPGALAFTLALIAGVLAHTAPPAHACEGITARTQAAYQAGDLAALQALHSEAEATAGCSDDTLAWIGKAVVTTALKTVQADLAAGGLLTTHEGTLRRVRPYGQDWRLDTWLGDIAFDRARYTEAARAYQDALTTLNDESLTPKAPDVAVIKEVFTKAELARLAADEYVGAPVTRSGRPGGLGAVTYRGFRPTQRLWPVEFQFGSTLVTAKGLLALRELRDVLLASGAQTVTLVGHTDPVGGLAANDRLSMARARAVADTLRNEGYGGEIILVGMGERDPMPWPSLMPRRHYHQMLRRVEVRM